ncbi:hypothetical protein A2165_02480 [Candidatus Curtissbacteria bacterium RBG_13_40_7]|uniref:Cupin type-2 domain-containing protein n=1 Tax=Candidatus Curtissbacteria bacterium RBG_13_40_7 TaxID=1797706 RepID=A0A1F5FYJ6_9BACT|nr:MAG: hypothetical protein A2165_02480 [Candidatus Curtissbacteria bacterium RBG_13_40_7]
MKLVNQKQRSWEPASHEDQTSPGLLKKVIVRHNEVNPKSKLMMVNVSKIPVGKVHKAHSHKTMEEIFYFTDGQGEIKIDDKVEKVVSGDRVIVPAKSIHQVKNTGNIDLRYICLGIALD